MSDVKTYIVGNWKMNGDAVMALPLVENIAVQAAKKPAQVEIVLCPPATLLHEVARAMIGTDMRLGGQDCHVEASGAFTGDISASMLKESGCSYVIVGHSERRAIHGETNALVSKKATAALNAGLIPIICIGETKAEREAGVAHERVATQLIESIPDAAVKGDFILAYEPVWAIGTGLTATVGDIRDMHHHILQVVSKKTGLANARITVLYGGSVKAANAREILTTDGVSGVLVGGASLKADEFCNIVAAAAS